MGYEILYTSAPQGLRPGSSGYCTVQSSRGIPAPTVELLESLSGYRHLFPLGHAQAELNPVNHGHYILRINGRREHVLSRVSDYDLDYTGRSNKLAHHVVIDDIASSASGPAWLLKYPGWMKDRWDGEVCHLGDNAFPTRTARSSLVCSTWAEATGDAGWAGVVAEAFLADPTQKMFLIFQPGTDVLRLFGEVIALLPESKRWEVTFATYGAALPSSVECLWNGIAAGSPEVETSRRFAQALRIDLTEELGRAQGGALVNAARTGSLPTQLASKSTKSPGSGGKSGTTDGSMTVKDFASDTRKPRVADTRHRDVPPPLPGKREIETKPASDRSLSRYLIGAIGTGAIVATAIVVGFIWLWSGPATTDRAATTPLGTPAQAVETPQPQQPTIIASAASSTAPPTKPEASPTERKTPSSGPGTNPPAGTQPETDSPTPKTKPAPQQPSGKPTPEPPEEPPQPGRKVERYTPKIFQGSNSSDEAPSKKDKIAATGDNSAHAETRPLAICITGRRNEKNASLDPIFTFPVTWARPVDTVRFLIPSGKDGNGITDFAVADDKLLEGESLTDSFRVNATYNDNTRQRESRSLSFSIPKRTRVESASAYIPEDLSLTFYGARLDFSPAVPFCGALLEGSRPVLLLFRDPPLILDSVGLDPKKNLFQFQFPKSNRADQRGAEDEDRRKEDFDAFFNDKRPRLYQFRNLALKIPEVKGNVILEDAKGQNLFTAPLPDQGLGLKELTVELKPEHGLGLPSLRLEVKPSKEKAWGILVDNQRITRMRLTTAWNSLLAQHRNLHEFVGNNEHFVNSLNIYKVTDKQLDELQRLVDERFGTGEDGTIKDRTVYEPVGAWIKELRELTQQVERLKSYFEKTIPKIEIASGRIAYELVPLALSNGPGGDKATSSPKFEVDLAIIGGAATKVEYYSDSSANNDQSEKSE